MRKSALSYAVVGGFEMPAMHQINLEKENNNIVYASTPKTVYSGSGFKYSRSALLQAALGDELGKNNISGAGV